MIQGDNQFVDPSIVKKAKKRPVTFEEHMQKYDELLKLVSDEIDKRAREGTAGTRAFRKIRKKIVVLQKETPKVMKKKYRPKSKKRSGFILDCEISDELRTFLKLKKGENLSRIDITNAICVYAHLDPKEKREKILRWKHLNPNGKRDLQDPDNKRAIVPDAALSKLLGYKKYVSDVEKGKVKRIKTDPVTKEKHLVVEEDSTLYYYVIQKLIQKHIVKTIPSVDKTKIAEESKKGKTPATKSKKTVVKKKKVESESDNEDESENDESENDDESENEDSDND